MSPKISIIIPVFKAEQVLAECVDSVLHQTFSDFEVLLVDDGSPDASGKICDDYARKDARVRVFHTGNGGVSAARNRGLNEAKGECVVFVDADDWIDSDYLATFAKADLSANALWFQGYKKVSVEKVTAFSLVPQLTTAKTISRNDLFLYWGVWGKLFHRATIEKLNLRFDVTLSLGEDTIFFFQYLAGVDELKVRPEVGYNYRVAGVSLSRKVTPWDVHCAGSCRIYEAARPQVERFLRGQFCYRKRFLNLLIYEQHALRLETLYSGGYGRAARVEILKETFGCRWQLLQTCYPVFSRKWRYSLLWAMFIVLPISIVEKILSQQFKPG